MIKHLFTLIWNKKKQNFLLIMEMFISFLVMFAIFTLLVQHYSTYKKPMGFEYENVWAVNYSIPDDVMKKDSNGLFLNSLTSAIRSHKAVEDLTVCSNNLPFSMNTSNSMIEYNKKSVLTHFYDTDDHYASVLSLKMAEGRWFNRQDNASRDKPVVINMTLKEKFFPGETALGKIIDLDKRKMKVIGVVNDFKDKGDYQLPDACLYNRIDSSTGYMNSILVKVRPNTDAAAESRLYKTLSNTLKDSNVEIEHLAVKRTSKNKLTLVPMIIMLIVGSFLIINVALGLFGVLWYNINKRRGEIGLRRAVGASGNGVTRQLIGEALVLSTLSLILGSFFAVQFPLLHVFDLSSMVYITALVLSIIFIYLLVILCALYPGKQAAAIYPAVALHEE
jgi:putative ABC transport system permease protein